MQYSTIFYAVRSAAALEIWSQIATCTTCVNLYVVTDRQLSQAASFPFAAQAALTYVIDCHPQDANQAFVTINFIKAVFTFVATTYVNDWYTNLGAQGVGIALASVNLSVSLLTIPSYIYGKRFRSMVSTITSAIIGWVRWLTWNRSLGAKLRRRSRIRRANGRQDRHNVRLRYFLVFLNRCIAFTKCT